MDFITNISYETGIIFMIVFVLIILVVKNVFKWKIHLLWIILLSVVITLLVNVGYTYGAFYLLGSDKYDEIEFNQEKWNQSDIHRYEMVDDLINSEVLLDKSSEEIFNILGKPTFGDTTNYIEYDLGDAHVGMGIHRIILNIEFEKGASNKVEKESIHLDD